MSKSRSETKYGHLIKDHEWSIPQLVQDGGREVLFEYRDAVHDEDVRIVASPTDSGDDGVGDEWEVVYEKRTAGTQEWNRFATDYATKKPELQDAE